MPIFGAGLSIGSVSKIPNYDLDASTFILSNGISDTATIPILGKTNYVVSSFSDSYYYNTSLCSITSGALANPFGTATDAVLLKGTPVAYGRILRTNASVGVFYPNTSYIISCYAKTGTHNLFGMRVSSESAGSGGNNYVTFDLTNNVYYTQTPISGTIDNVGMIDVGAGWYRCYFKYTTGATTSATLCDFALPSAVSGDVQATGSTAQGVYIWGPMVEQTTNTTPSSLTYRNGIGTGSGEDVSISMPNGSLTYETINPRKLINDFVVGAKALNVWNNFICWPMRSMFNVGSGINIQSLGSLGSFPALSVSGASWTPYGIKTQATNKYVGSIAVGSGFTNLSSGSYSWFSVFKQFDKAEYNYLLNQYTQASGPGFRTGPYATTPYLTFYANTAGTSSFVLTNTHTDYGFNSINMLKSGSTSIATSINSGSFQTTSLTGIVTGGSASAGYDFGNANSYVAGGYRSFEAISTSVLSQANAIALNTLIKTTLCYGL